MLKLSSKIECHTVKLRRFSVRVRTVKNNSVEILIAHQTLNAYVTCFVMFSGSFIKFRKKLFCKKEKKKITLKPHEKKGLFS